MLLRYGIYYGDTRWTVAHHGWLSKQKFDHPGANEALKDYLGAVDALVVRRDWIEKALHTHIAGSSWEQTVNRLRCMRGIDTLTAVGLCAEIFPFDRFSHPKQLMSYVGLTPCESSSGETRRLGGITKSGSSHARRLFIEAAWHYLRAPSIGRPLKQRQKDQPPEIIALAWKAQRRLYNNWQRLAGKRGKRKSLVAAAVARELAGFCWVIATNE
jgi:transposase